MRRVGRAGPVFFCILLCACAGPEEPPASPGSGESPPDQEAWGWTTTVTEGGRRRAMVKAAHFRKFDSSRKAELDGGVAVRFYNTSGTRQASELTAHRAEIDEESGDMVVFGNVVLVSEDSTRLETDTLSWHRKTEKITGQGRVTIRRPDGLETGVGFEASSDLKRWTMREVTTRLGQPDSLR